MLGWFSCVCVGLVWFGLCWFFGFFNRLHKIEIKLPAYYHESIHQAVPCLSSWNVMGFQYCHVLSGSRDNHSLSFSKSKSHSTAGAQKMGRTNLFQFLDLLPRDYGY